MKLLGMNGIKSRRMKANQSACIQVADKWRLSSQRAVRMTPTKRVA